MPEMLAIVYPDVDTALKVRERLQQLEGEYVIELADAVVVSKDDKGDVKLLQAVDLVKQGAIGGGLWGGLIGLIFMNPLFGLAVGAAVGAISGKISDYGIPDDQMREIGETFQPGTAALFLLVTKLTADKVIPEIASFGGTVLRSSLSHEEDARLRDALKNHGVAAVATPAPAAP
jgi:uncharacterized membrane protein